MNKKELIFKLNLSKKQFLNYYKGIVRKIVVRSFNGKTVKFPAGILQKFISDNGINGIFKIIFDSNNKFIGIEEVK